MNCKSDSSVYLIFCIVVFLSFFTVLFSQENIQFNSDFYTFSEKPGEIEILIIVYVPYDQMNFTVSDSFYTAELDVSAILYSSGKQKGGEIWRREVLLSEYEKTKSLEDGVKWSFSIPAQPGKFDLHIRVEDTNSNRSGERIDKLEVEKAKKDNLWVSQLVFFKMKLDEQKEWLNSNALNVESDSIFTLVSIVSGIAKDEDYLLRVKVIDGKGKEVLKVNSYIEIDSLLSQKTIVLPIKKLKEGDYDFRVEVLKNGKILAASSKFAHIVFPFFLSKRYEDRVEQMVYIADSKEMKKLKESTKEEREKAWNEFWSTKDPIPETPVNETSEEYFKRVDYADKHFRSFQSGWRTDRGRIYIIYGKPDEIEYHPFELESAPYQVWYYYNIGRRFLFIDFSMTGDYALSKEIR